MTPTTYVGQSVLRREDRRFLTGTARYTEDITRPGLLHAWFVRSTVAHARAERLLGEG